MYIFAKNPSVIQLVKWQDQTKEMTQNNHTDDFLCLNRSNELEVNATGKIIRSVTSMAIKIQPFCVEKSRIVVTIEEAYTCLLSFQREFPALRSLNNKNVQRTIQTMDPINVTVKELDGIFCQILNSDVGLIATSLIRLDIFASRHTDSYSDSGNTMDTLLHCLIEKLSSSMIDLTTGDYEGIPARMAVFEETVIPRLRTETRGFLIKAETIVASNIEDRKKILHSIFNPKLPAPSRGIGRHLLSSENRSFFKKNRGSYNVRPISKKKIDKASSEPISISIIFKGNSSEKPKTLDNIYVEKGLKGVTCKLVNELKQLTPLSNFSVNPNNKQDTLENQSIKKHLNSKLEKEINKEIGSLIEQTQLEELSTNATSDSSFERHKLFKPLIKLRDGLQEDHNLDVFTDQLSNQANKSLLGMDYNTRAKVVEEAVGSENIDIDALSRATENNYNRNYGHFPDTLPTNSADELANAIIDLNLSEIGEDVLNKKLKPNKKKLPQHKAVIQKKKERNTLKIEIEIEIEKLISSGKLDTTKLETKYQKLKTENHEKTVSASKTELQTQYYIENITLQAVRENLGEEQSKTDIDDRWSAIKTKFDDQLGQAIDEAIKIIHTYQEKATPSNENTKQEDSLFTTGEINNSLEFYQSLPESSLDSKDNESFA